MLSHLSMETTAVMGLFVGMVGRAPDAELVERFQAGDVDAFSEIVGRYQHRVYTLALRWMRDPALAEEVAQDVFIALYRSLAKFRGDSKLSTWVYRVVVNHCKNRLQYRKRRHMEKHEPLEGTGGDDGPARQLPSHAPGADAGRHRSEAEQLVHDALGRLDEEQRQVIVLRDIEDLSYDEIGLILGVPRGTVKSRLHRARAQLAAVLSRQVSSDDVL